MLMRDSAVLPILSMPLTKMYNFIWIIQLAKLSQHSQNFNLFYIEQTTFSRYITGTERKYKNAFYVYRNLNFEILPSNQMCILDAYLKYFSFSVMDVCAN